MFYFRGTISLRRAVCDAENPIALSLSLSNISVCPLERDETLRVWSWPPYQHWSSLQRDSRPIYTRWLRTSNTFSQNFWSDRRQPPLKPSHYLRMCPDTIQRDTTTQKTPHTIYSLISHARTHSRLRLCILTHYRCKEEQRKTLFVFDVFCVQREGDGSSVWSRHGSDVTERNVQTDHRSNNTQPRHNIIQPAEYRQHHQHLHTHDERESINQLNTQYNLDRKNVFQIYSEQETWTGEQGRTGKQIGPWIFLPTSALHQFCRGGGGCM